MQRWLQIYTKYFPKISLMSILRNMDESKITRSQQKIKYLLLYCKIYIPDFLKFNADCKYIHFIVKQCHERKYNLDIMLVPGPFGPTA